MVVVSYCTNEDNNCEQNAFMLNIEIYGCIVFHAIFSTLWKLGMGMARVLECSLNHKMK